MVLVAVVLVPVLQLLLSPKERMAYADGGARAGYRADGTKDGTEYLDAVIGRCEEEDALERVEVGE